MCCAGAYQRVLFTQLLRNGEYLKGVSVLLLVFSGCRNTFLAFYVLKMANVGNSGVIT